MGIMSNLARLDSALQRGLDNSFAAVFGGKVVPAEIEELLKQEAEDNAVHTYEGSIEAPNVYIVSVSEKDLMNLRQQAPDLPESFADRMTRHCRNQGWSLMGPLVVEIAADQGLKTGQLRAESDNVATPDKRSGFRVLSPETSVSEETPLESTDSAQESEAMNSSNEPFNQMNQDEQDANTELFAGAEPDSGSLYSRLNQEGRAEQADTPGHNRGPAVSLLLQDGSSRTYHVHEGSNIIGRSTDADFRLPDTGVSRQHAEITWDGQDAVLVDLHSTNGTTVNDTPVENWLLADGDVITVGHSHIEVRIIGSDAYDAH